MKIPLQITFRNMEPSPALAARIRKLAGRLEKFSANILRCHVLVDAPHKHHHQGGRFAVVLDVTVPEKRIATGRNHANRRTHEDAYVALRDAFRATRRRLEDYERERQERAKAGVGPAQGRVRERLARIASRTSEITVA